MVLARQCLVLQFSKMTKNAIFRGFNLLFLKNIKGWKVFDSCSARKMPSESPRGILIQNPCRIRELPYSIVQEK